MAQARPYRKPTGPMSVRKTENLVFDEAGRGFLLGEIVGGGGEGNVHKAVSQGGRRQDFMAKIYLPDRIASVNWTKLKRLLSISWPKEGICHPLSILYDGKDGRRKPVGFLMAAAEGKTLNATLHVNALRRIGWSRTELCNLALAVLSMFERLHTRGILMADVNPRNIMVDQEDPSKVYFIDVDSYQVGTDARNGYACLVSRQEFLSNRLLDKDFGSGTVFRDMDDELYAITTLLFTIFLPEIFPYARRGEGNLEQLNRERRFVFPNGYTDNGEVHRGAESLWYELPKPMCVAFYETFKDGRFHDIEEWRELIEDYKEEILNNRKSSVIYPSEAPGRSVPIFLGDKPDDEQPESAGHNRLVSDDTQRIMPMVIEFNADGFHVSVPQYGFREHPEANLSYRSFSHDVELWNHVNEKGELDLTRLSGIKFSDTFINYMRAYIERMRPPLTVIHAMGRSFLRNISNRAMVTDSLKNLMGYSFRYLTAEEEASMLLSDISCKDGAALLVNQTALSLMLALRYPDGRIEINEIPTLGRYTVKDWFIATQKMSSKTVSALGEHDAEVYATIRKECRGIIKACRAEHLSAMVVSGMAFPGAGENPIHYYKSRRDRLSRSILQRDNIAEIYSDLHSEFSEDFREKFITRLSIPVMTSLLSLLGEGGLPEIVKAPRPSEAYIRYLYS